MCDAICIEFDEIDVRCRVSGRKSVSVDLIYPRMQCIDESQSAIKILNLINIYIYLGYVIFK